jgi:phage gp29-like protein
VSDRTKGKPGDRVGFGRRLATIMNRAAAVMSYRLHVAAANLWRDNYNPLRGLTISRAVSLLEAGERGEYADLQWTYRFIEMQDATLGALLERRTSAIQKLDWNIKVRDGVPAGKEQVAKTQEAALRAAYERITNLSAALEAMAMASFRGFTHLEKVQDSQGNVVEFAPVDQWFWVRRGIYGRWQMNKDARFGVALGEDVPLDRFIVREVSRPINRVALVCFVRKAVSQKDWDGFIETFGIPAVFIVMPDNVPADKEEEFLDAADQVSSDARGVLPGGSDVKTVDNGARGQNPFKEHIDYQDSQVVLRGTGGKLTMLNDATGIGGNQSETHEKTFDEIARAEAAEISEILRKQFDAGILAAVTPGEPAFAYFELAANEETDAGEVVKDVAALDAAGYEVAEDFIKEKTGYPVKRKPAANPAASPVPVDPILNRGDGETWRKFKRETGTLGIPREVMPQIDQGNRAAMVAFLRKRGIDYVRETAKPSDLKPSQAEYAPAKVEKAKGFTGTPRALLVSSDHHVIDGHHQYLAALQDAPNVPIEVFRLKAPAMQVIGTLLAMPSTTTADMPIRNRAGDTLAKALGVTSDALAPVADLFDELAKDVQGERQTDAEWLAAVEEAAARMPEFFDTSHADELADALEAAMGGAALEGARQAITETRESE